MWNLNIVKMNYLYGCQELRRRWESKELGVWDQQMQTVTITGWINNKVLPYSTGNYIQYPVINHNGKEYEKVKVKSLSRVRLLATLWTVALQAPLSMGFSRQEYWSGLPFPSPGDLPNPGIKPGSPALQADALLSEPPGKLA